MFKNYFKIAWRNMVKQKMLTFINVIGLSAGIACFALFLLYAINEFGFDRFNKDAKNIYQVNLWAQFPGADKPVYGTYFPYPFGPALKKDLPEVKNYVRIQNAWGDIFVKVNDQDTRRLKVSFADPQLFSIFTFRFVQGNAATALQGLNNIVLTQSKAKELFGNENAVGRTLPIKVDSVFEPFTVSAVTEDVPPNSSIKYDLLGNLQYLETTSLVKPNVNSWNSSSLITYVQLQPGSNVSGKELLAFRKRYYPDDEKQMQKQGLKKDSEMPLATYQLQPLLTVHTNPEISNSMVESINPKTIWILLSIAGGVLIIACINFTTLAIGRSAGRAKEVGIRKVIGGKKQQLILQFLSEAMLLTVFSAILGLLLAKILLPYFNELSGRALHFSLELYPEIAWMLAALIVMVGILAGSYPALILSRLKPVEVLKSKVHIGGANFFTKALVTLQFTLSVGLIISTIIILQQTHYMSSKYPGFNKENVIVVDASQTDTKRIYPLFKQALLSNTEIVGVAAAQFGLGEGEGWNVTGFEYNGKQKEFYRYVTDQDYVKVLGMQLLAGRTFNPSIASDTINSIIINEAMMHDFGWSLKNVIGQQLTGFSEKNIPVVIGVIKNFNYRALSEKIEPQMFCQFGRKKSLNNFFVRIKPGSPATTINLMQKSWKKLAPDYPLKYSFLDENLNNFYKGEQRWSNIVGWAGGISIFLACLGLFGLVSLAVINRTKEIGIRKILGASAGNLAGMLSKDFLVLVVIASIVAFPIAWWAMNKWLQSFAYRINISWWMFVVAGVAALLIALLTVGFQAIKAAVANPVESLRSE